MKHAAIVPIVFAACLFCLGAAAEEGRFLDLSGGQVPNSEAAGRFESAQDCGTRHDGFRIDPLPGDWLIPLAEQRSHRGFRGKATSTRRHSTLAVAKISPVAPKPLRLEDIRPALERKLKRAEENGRIRDSRCRISDGTRNGAPTLELRTECIDTGTAPESKMISVGFVVVTADNRMLVVSVSERSTDPDFRFDPDQAEAFFRAVRWNGDQSPQR